MQEPNAREVSIYILATTLLGASVVPVFAQQSSTFPTDQTNATSTDGTALLNNSTDFESARQQYLEAWNQTGFGVAFSTYIEPYTEQGFGVYTEHPSNVFRPGDTITLYVEPKGFSHVPVLDEQGNTLYQMNLTARVAIEDESGNLLATIEDLPPFELVSHRKNTELFMTVTVTQQQPFPEGMYRLTYEIGDGQTGETTLVTNEIRIAQTVTT
jgi:hypothetical protein